MISTVRLANRPLLAATAFILISLSAAAQDTAAPNNDAATPASEQSPAITADDIKKRQAALEDAELSDEQKSKAEKYYQNALEQLKLADQHLADAKRWKSLQQEAPAKTEKLEALLTEPRTPSTVEVDSDATLATLDQQLATARQELADAQANLKQLQEEPQRRADRRIAFATEQQAAQDLLDKSNEVMQAPPTPGLPDALVLAERTMNEATRQAAECELQALAAELPAYDATNSLIDLEVQAAQRAVLDAQDAVKQLSELLSNRRRDQSAQQSQDARSALADVHPFLQPMAKENLQLADRRSGPDGLTARIKNAEEQLLQAKETASELDELEHELSEKLDLLADTSMLGEFLMRLRRDLPRDADLQRQSYLRNQEIATTRIEAVDASLIKAQFDNLDQALEKLQSQLDGVVDPAEHDIVMDDAKRLYSQRQQLLRDLDRDYTNYLSLLKSLNLQQQQLRAKTRRVKKLIDEHLMWVQGNGVYSTEDLQQVPQAAAWMLQRDNWRQVGDDAWKALRLRPIFCVASLLLFVILAVSRRSLQRRLKSLGDEAASSYLAPFTVTLKALGVTFLLTWLWPSLVLGLGWCLYFSFGAAPFTRAVGAGLIISATVYVALELTRRLLSRKGLAEAHFRWMDRRIALARGHLAWLSVSLLPLLFWLGHIQWEGDPERQATLGRLLFAVSMILVAIFLHRVMRPLPVVVEGVESPRPPTSALVVYWIAVSLPLLIGGLSLAGFHFTAWQLAGRLFVTACLTLAMLVFNGLAIRWLRHVRGRLAIHQAQQRREAREQATTSETHSEDEAAAEVEPEIDLQAVNQQTRQLLHVCVSVTIVVGFWLIWLEVMPFREYLDTPLWSRAASVNLVTSETGDGDVASISAVAGIVTVSDVVLALLLITLALLAGRNIPGLVEISLPVTAPLDSGARYALSTIIRYTLVGGGIVLAFSIMGFGWSRLQWMVAALSVGVGFGLQELVANFISGLILLFERPVRVGDIVSIDGVTGVVRRVQIRATTIRNWDRQDYIVPNKDLITGRVLNWTLTNAVNRVVINVGVSYDSDTRQVRSLLEQIVGEYPDIMEDPAPLVTFEEFGDSTLNFVVRAFLADMDSRLETINNLHTTIHERFAAAGIEIAFPQRDINIRSLPSGDLNAMAESVTSGDKSSGNGEPTGN